MMLSRSARCVAGTSMFALLFWGSSGLAPAAAAQDGAEAAAPAASDSGDGELTGDQIYERILDNRFTAYIQDLHMTSGDRGGSEMKTEINLRYKNYRKDKKKKHILSKTIAKYRAPQDVRHLGYLIINKASGKNDEFIYQPSARRVRRINLRGEAVFGTDFSFEDIIPQELEDGTYRRLADTQVEGVDCYAVEVIPTADADSEYSKFIVNVDKEHFVPLQTDYWDEKDIHIKRLNADPKSIKGYEDLDAADGKSKQIWISTYSKIVHLKLDTWSELKVMSLESKPKLKDRDFSERELTASH